MNIPLFQGLSKKEISHLGKLMYKRQFKKNEVVFVEGDIGAAMYIIIDGKVSIIKSAGKRKLEEVACLGPGAFFGEMSLLTDNPRSATGKTKANTTLLCFFKKDLDHVLQKHPPMGLKLMKNMSTVLAKRLNHAIERIEDQ